VENGAETTLLQLGKRILSAREDCGWTQADLAEKVGLDRTAVSKIERGDRKISATELVRLAASLDRPIDWFVTESPQAVVSRRSDPAVEDSGVLDRTLERLARDVEFLEREGTLPEIGKRTMSLPEDFEAAEAAAGMARSWMDADDGPLLDLQRKSESLGLLVFCLDLGAQAGDASYVAVERWGVAVVNGACDPGRRRFNAAHELGHHLFDDAYAPEITIGQAGSATERMINAFVAHLLLPRSAVSKTWAEFDNHRLAAVAVAMRFRTSWTTVCAQLKNLELISETERQDLVAQPPTSADSIELGERWVSELNAPSGPPAYGQRIVAAYRTGKLTAERAVELLYGSVVRAELPPRQEIPLDAFRREFDPLT